MAGRVVIGCRLTLCIGSRVGDGHVWTLWWTSVRVRTHPAPGRSFGGERRSVGAWYAKPGMPIASTSRFVKLCPAFEYSSIWKSTLPARISSTRVPVGHPAASPPSR